jgi:hypothetical protein
MMGLFGSDPVKRLESLVIGKFNRRLMRSRIKRVSSLNPLDLNSAIMCSSKMFTGEIEGGW